ncbi:DUF2867 domain-containing protein [Vibrio lamellibrachiae]|uniref:DUF2867 domain-containing protein n=1 Tax=Vibrio lamellibrachiae TaxID=2910253 RepID=UPI003D0E70E1
MDIPSNTLLQDSLGTAYFKDCHTKTIPYSGESAFDIYSQIAQKTPAWVIRLMALRNWTVSKLGLKHLGQMNEFDHEKTREDFKPGDTIGIFKVVANLEHEIVMEDRDKHLDVRLSFLIEPKGEQAIIHATTVVHVHNIWGKIYMFFVAPVHKVIVPSSLKQLA